MNGQTLEFSFLSEEPPASLSASPASEKDWTTTAATWPSSMLTLLRDTGPAGLFGRTSPEFSAVPAEPTLLHFWALSRAGQFVPLETVGETLEPSKESPTLTASPGELSTLSFSEWPNDGVACLLSDTLETGDVPLRHFLRPQACAGILRRAKGRGRNLPALLQQILELVALREPSDDHTIRPIPAPRPAMQPIPFDPVQITSPENRSNPKPGSAVPTLAAQEKAPCIAFEPRTRGDDGRGYSRPPATFEDISPTLQTIKTPCVTASLQRAGVRRLTARECERLQGFPDDYTLVPSIGSKWQNKSRRRSPDDYAETVAYLMAAGWTEAEALALANTPDGPRYKAIGNSMAVPVMAWIGRRIALVETLTVRKGTPV